MIQRAYLAPTENPPTQVDIKRALLTFDQVLIADPADRDFFPPQSFMMAVGMPPIFGINTGPVRPLGKSADYDDRFDQLLDEVQIARREGLIDVVSSYDLTSSSHNSFGAVLMGDYPLHPGLLLWAYRSIASETAVLHAAIKGDDKLLSLTDEQIAALAMSQARADGGINNDPTLPSLDGHLAREHLRNSLTLVARGRIAATMKSIGYCAAKDLAPIFTERNFGSLVNTFAQKATAVVDKIGQEDPYWAKRNKTLEIAHDEYLNEDVLSKMSIDEVLKLRTVVWGRQAEARDALFKSAAHLARDASNGTDFESAVQGQISEYRRLSEELQKQRSSLSFTVKCELAKGGLGGVTPLMGAGAAGSVLSQTQTAMGAGTLLLAGCLWAVNKYQQLKPTAAELREAEAKFQDNLCFGLHNFYRRMGQAVGSKVI